MFKIEEFSLTEVLHKDRTLRKGGFDDVFDAIEYAVNVLGSDTVKGGSEMIIQQRIHLKKVPEQRSSVKKKVSK